MKEALLRDLHAYHDGELGGLRRWWVERRIARDPVAQAELARLTAVGDALRAEAVDVRAPDLWSRIVLQLPAAAPVAAQPEHSGFGFSLPKWAGAVVAAGAVAYALLFVGPRPPSPGPAGDAIDSSVQMLDTGRHPAFILQDDREATIIWLLPKQSADAGGDDHAMG